jgi:hypothetical protein
VYFALVLIACEELSDLIQAILFSVSSSTIARTIVSMHGGVSVCVYVCVSVCVCGFSRYAF